MRMSSKKPGIRSGRITQIRERMARKSINARDTKLVLRERLLLSGTSLFCSMFFHVGPYLRSMASILPRRWEENISDNTENFESCIIGTVTPELSLVDVVAFNRAFDLYFSRGRFQRNRPSCNALTGIWFFIQ